MKTEDEEAVLRTKCWVRNDYGGGMMEVWEAMRGMNDGVNSLMKF